MARVAIKILDWQEIQQAGTVLQTRIINEARAGTQRTRFVTVLDQRQSALPLRDREQVNRAEARRQARLWLGQTREAAELRTGFTRDFTIDTTIDT